MTHNRIQATVKRYPQSSAGHGRGIRDLSSALDKAPSRMLAKTNFAVSISCANLMREKQEEKLPKGTHND